MNRADREAILESMRALKPDAESSARRKVFLPVKAHARALRPEVVVIQGARGAGKTALFELSTELGGELSAFFADKSIPTKAHWVEAFAETVDHPNKDTLDEFARAHGRDEELRAFWLGHLVGRLADENLLTLPASFSTVRNQSRGDPTRWIAAAVAQSAVLHQCLDELECLQEKKAQYLFLAYDYLDRIGEFDSSGRSRYVKTLLSLWLSLSGRYKFIRPKIFLRHDLFAEAQRSFPDASKLRARSESLDWSVLDLFRLSVRHLANSEGNARPPRDWLRGMGIELKAEGEFGYMPVDFTEDSRDAFSKGLAGEVMGAGVRKGYTSRWIPARLQDADGRIVPRSMLRLLSHAAREALSAPMGKGDSLLRPTDLQAALVQTSLDRVSELGSEYEVVNHLQKLRGAVLLLEKSEAVRLLSEPLEGQKKSTDGSAVLEELKRVGVIAERSDGRIDVPDIYRYGYGIKRKGGVKQPR